MGEAGYLMADSGAKKSKKDVDYAHPSLEGHGDNSIQLALVMLIAQIAFIILFGIFTEYDRENLSDEELTRMYPWFQEYMLEADFTTGAILISFGAVLGVASPVQLLLMILFEVIFYNINAYILVFKLGVSDMGGSMVVHAFGCYFGLAVARCLYKQGAQMDNPAEGAEYHSDLFSMIGTVFLWMFWPSFNSAPGADEHRYVAVINTYLALCSACVATFITSILTNPKRRITMEHIQNATLAGGVAMGTASDMNVEPVGALTIGFLAGVLSTVGYAYIKPFLADKINLHDTCGVNNLHGMPAVMAAVISIIFCAINPSPYVNDEAEQGWLTQLYCLLCTLGCAIVGGLVTGGILRIPLIEYVDDYSYFEDGKYWEVEVEEEDDEEK